MLNVHQIQFFEKNGYLAVNSLLSADEVAYFRKVYDDFLTGKIDTADHRSDLSGKGDGTELITQIMRPSLLMPSLGQSVIHQKTTALAQKLMGDDMEVDFDMLINKAPYTGAETPWHQDEAYWIHMDDKRAVSCWIALDHATLDNGCMWFVPGSHLLPLRPHVLTGKGGALQCAGDEAEAIPVELQPGGCTLHHGRTIHYSRGNKTAGPRRAFIINLRPSAMVAFERSQGFDHLGNRQARGKMEN